jgi:hypothetical protein
MAGEPEEAIAACKRALELAPNYAEAHCNLGAAYHWRGDWEQAKACFDRSLAIEEHSASARANRSALMLLKGDMEHGWPEYEWRWKVEGLAPRRFAQPPWRGEALEGRSILLHTEQGLGDTIQFIRYAELLKRRGATVFVECQQPLMKLLASSPDVDGLITQGDDLPQFDFQAPLLSLPAVFKTTLDTIPAPVPYLFAKPSLVSRWRDELKRVGEFRIGINWKGRSEKGPWLQRNVPLELFTPLARVPGVRLISLQKGEGRRDLAALADRTDVVDLGQDVDSAEGAFMDTAAIMKNLDLVITSDTAVPHVAGALGVAVWVVLPYVPDWRWLLERSDSPWYPTMRLFRQKVAGDWAGVFEEVGAALRALVT